jgi:predicted PurR-regulated permease PerM
MTENQGKTIREYPFYIKATVILLGLMLACSILHMLGSVLVPFAFACLVAILLNPLSTAMQRRLPRSIAVSCAVLAAIALVAALIYFLSTQILNFSETLPALKAKSGMITHQVETWISSKFGIAINKQVQMINNALQGSESYVGETLNSVLDGIGVIVLIPIYVFFLLFYKPLILDFLFQAFSEKHSLRVAEILAETKTAIQSYVMGLLIEMAIVSAMNSAALLALGVRSAILLGVIGGILNVVPYLGGLVAIALPVLMATVTKEGYSTQTAIILLYMVIQIIDNNVLVPQIVSSKVKINALFSILVVLAGGMLWGYSGMFLSIPFVAILKIIFDRIDGLKPWGHLLGTTIPEQHAGIKWQARWDMKLRKRKLRQATVTVTTTTVRTVDELADKDADTHGLREGNFNN